MKSHKVQYPTDEFPTIRGYIKHSFQASQMKRFFDVAYIHENDNC